MCKHPTEPSDAPLRFPAGEERQIALDEFYQEWKDDSLVILKWLGLQTGSNIRGNLRNVQQLLKHPAVNITNPNTCYSVFLGFVRSPVNFHSQDGSGYNFMADSTLEVSLPTAFSVLQKPVSSSCSALCELQGLSAQPVHTLHVFRTVPCATCSTPPWVVDKVVRGWPNKLKMFDLNCASLHALEQSVRSHALEQVGQVQFMLSGRVVLHHD